MIRIGIVGLGFMGKMHFDTYQSLKEKAKVVAICEIDAKKRAGDWSGIAGNIEGAASAPNLDGVQMFEHFEDFLKCQEVDVIDITLPTYLHKDFTEAAFMNGKHVICEKPLSISSESARNMVSFARKSNKQLFVGQCIRFWPGYTTVKELVQNNTYGKVKTALFRRLSPKPTWSWENWLQDVGKSGRAALDLHIHDADFISYVFGTPKAVQSFGYEVEEGGFDHINTRYIYDDNSMITAEGAWEYSASFPFSMTFIMHFEQASVIFDGCKLTAYLPDGKKKVLAKDETGGYLPELEHFIDCLATGKSSDILTPESAAESVRIIEAETESAKNQTVIAL